MMYLSRQLALAAVKDWLLNGLILVCAYWLFLSPVIPGIDGSGDGKSLKLPITSIAQQIIAKEHF